MATGRCPEIDAALRVLQRRRASDRAGIQTEPLPSNDSVFVARV
jgi:hypothetical protein